jgi:hypothetical protein
MNYVKKVHNSDRTVTWAQCFFKECDFECEHINSMEAQIHELMHTLDSRLADLFHASIGDL